jgi:PhnB protein
MAIVPYLHFNGTCAEALHFYEQALGATTTFKMTFGESPMAAQMPPGSGSRIMHATLDIDGQPLMASDTHPEMGYAGMHGFAVSLSYDSTHQARKVFDALAEGGAVRLPLQKTFWSAAFGMLTDRFGTPWMINCDQEPG